MRMGNRNVTIKNPKCNQFIKLWNPKTQILLQVTLQNHLYGVSRPDHLCCLPVEGMWNFSATLMLCPIFLGSVAVLALLCLGILCSMLRACGCVLCNKSGVYRNHRGNWLKNLSFHFFPCFYNLIFQWFLLALTKKNTLVGIWTAWKINFCGDSS